MKKFTTKIISGISLFIAGLIAFFSFIFSIFLISLLVSNYITSKNYYYSEDNMSFQRIIKEGDLKKIDKLISQKKINAYYDYQPLLIFAVKSNDIKVVEFLIKKGANVNMKGKGCWVKGPRMYAYGSCFSPLYQAVLNGNKEIAELLIKNGANVNFDYSGLKTLSLAKEKGNKEIIDILIANGAEE